MLTRKRSSNADSLIPILLKREPGEIPLGFSFPSSAFWDRDPSKRALMGYGIWILNNQTHAGRVARNVHARLEYRHADESFIVDPAGWFITDANQKFFCFTDTFHMEPGWMQNVAVAVRRGEQGSFETFAVKAKQDRLAPSVRLRFGKWQIRGLIDADNCRPIRIAATFSIDEHGNLVDLRSPIRAQTGAAPKGPHKATLERDRFIGSSRRTGRELCQDLTKAKYSLPSMRLKTIYRGDWVLWFDNKPEAVYKYFSAARKRFHQNISMPR
jgi:hypothetical protein